MTSGHTNRFERHRFLVLFFVVVAGVVAVDVAAATAYRLFTGQAWGMDLNDTERTYRVPSATHHHDIRPNVSIDDARWGPIVYPVRTNSLGFKDALVREVPLETDGERIVFIGDSFTEGIGVPYEQTFVGRVDRALAGRGIEVLNAAVASYSPSIYWRKTKYLIEEAHLEFDELVVFIDISDAIDEARNYRVDNRGNIVDRRGSPATTDTTGRWGVVRNYSIFVYTALRTARNLFAAGSDGTPEYADGADDAPEAAPARLLARPKMNMPRNLWTVDDAAYEDFGAQGVELMIDNMDRLADLLDQHGIALTVAVYPYPDLIVRHDVESRQVVIWREWCNAHGAFFIDYFPHFIGEDDWRVKEETIRRYFIPGDNHWNAAGHARIGDVFLDHYERR